MKRQSGKKRHAAFTLIEVLIVVIIMAVLAATVVPQFTDSTDDAKASTGLFNLHTLRSMIELYEAQHNGLKPSQSLVELTKSTDVDGNTGSGAAFPYGPYLQSIPYNPFTDSNTVVAPTEVPPTSTVAGAGWLYDKPSGQVWLNHADYLDK